MLTSAAAEYSPPGGGEYAGDAAVVLISNSEELQERVDLALAGDWVLLPAPIPLDPAELLERIPGGMPPEVLLLDASPTEIEQALALAAMVDEQFTRTEVVLVTELGDEIALPALRAGVRDVIDPEIDVPRLRAVLERAVQAVARTAPHVPAQPAISAAPIPTGRVICVVSPKGGVGKTTVSTNMAVGLARTAPHSTVIVDLDVQFGDVASGLALQPEFTLVDATRAVPTRDSMLLKTFLTLHPTGLYALCGPEDPAAADAVTPEDISAIVEMLACDFKYVIVDTSPGLTDHTLSAMDHATDLLLVTSMDVPGVRGLRKELDALDVLDIVPNGRHIVLNMADKKRGLSIADVTATLERDVHVVLPRAPQVINSVNLGQPLLQGNSRDPVTKQLRSLLARFAPPQASKQRGRHYRQTRGRFL